MPSARTTVTELGTALGMLGYADIDEAVRSRTPLMRSLSPEVWDQLAQLRAGGAYDAEFHAAWANGCAFLAADDGLRGRLPNVVEWKGTGRAPGDEVAPIDLRIDHVYLVSCKYLSNILFNVSPTHVFDSLLMAGQTRRGRAAREVLPAGGDWYAQVAPDEYQALYDNVLHSLRHKDAVTSLRLPSDVREGSEIRPGSVSHRAGAVSLPGLGLAATGAEHEQNGAAPRATPPAVLQRLPDRAADLTSEEREALAAGSERDGRPERRLSTPGCPRRWHGRPSCGGRWPCTVGVARARPWSGASCASGAPPTSSWAHRPRRSLRLRIATSWDWRQDYQLISVAMEPQTGGQPRVGWGALVRDRVSREVHEVAGHIEVRWSHGRFGGLPEAKGYLDTPHHLVPGYVALR